jgi:ribosomal protein S18 acetylase RimI-like enzyme
MNGTVVGVRPGRGEDERAGLGVVQRLGRTVTFVEGRGVGDVVLVGPRDRLADRGRDRVGGEGIVGDADGDGPAVCIGAGGSRRAGRLGRGGLGAGWLGRGRGGAGAAAAGKGQECKQGQGGNDGTTHEADPPDGHGPQIAIRGAGWQAGRGLPRAGPYAAPGSGGFVSLPAGLDVDALAALERHEARVHAFAGRSLRDLGDAVLVSDPINREPFWNRVSAVRWPSDTAGFDRRLDELVTLFATLDRLPHIWPRAVLNEPVDLVDRLVANGFIDLGGGHQMVLADRDRIAGSTTLPRGVTVERLHRLPPDERAEPASAIARLSAEAFGILDRGEAIEREAASLFDRPEVHALLLRVDGEPAAVAKRATFDGASYLSSIGTATAFRGRGLGRLVTALATADSLADGSRWVHLGVFAENHAAITLYRSLGFATLGEPAPDLIQP